ncbi:transcription antitermination factor NusB [Anaerotalea alkaliphila]|uniref:Transcription antitermination protein NusB n=1 Tax=Anaerotalea alkaliphila TaxID=2662126 RepID=A0A7X5HT98_9FIRM|nr:transcription antitermination factor NusB [Anaerotalea alkaliphila]
MNRRKQREHIFKIIFSAGFGTKEEWEKSADMYLSSLQQEREAEAAEEEADDVNRIVREKAMHVLEKSEEMDGVLNEATLNWSVDRMSNVDAAILRLAVYEMMYDEEVPVSVAINEAVELAKRFGGDTSASFINGVLANVAKKMG